MGRGGHQLSLRLLDGAWRRNRGSLSVQVIQVV
jgi:hypothetical protein